MARIRRILMRRSGPAKDKNCPWKWCGGLTGWCGDCAHPWEYCPANGRGAGDWKRKPDLSSLLIMDADEARSRGETKSFKTRGWV